MEVRGSLVTLCVMQMLLISAVGQAPAPSPVDSMPTVSPPAPPSEPSPVDAPLPAATPVAATFPINTSYVLTVGNGSFTGRESKVALSSPNGEYELALIMDGFGTESKTKYCWAEVHNTLGNLTFRENCAPRKIQMCSLSLTQKGDLRLTLQSSGATMVSWRTETEDDGVVDAKLDNTGVITLIKSDGSVVWTAADDKDRCLDAFNPANGSPGALNFSELAIVCTSTALLVLAVSSGLW